MHESDNIAMATASKSVLSYNLTDGLLLTGSEDKQQKSCCVLLQQQKFVFLLHCKN